MIASIEGTLTTTGRDFIIVRVGGVGFRVFVPQTFLESVGGPGDEIALFTHLHVRESELTLYGCISEEELALFRLLLGVSGIGPKVALATLSALPADQLRAAIAQEDVVTLSRVPGIGPKTARKMAFDLKDKVEAEFPDGEPHPILSEGDADLIAALASLGYSTSEAKEAMRSLPRESLPLEERVRLALAYFAP
jgi:Holliday junction DNA helicase RuvA